ncbi:heavy metal translocating P-type ATPase [Pseudonocardia xishanensis]
MLSLPEVRSAALALAAFALAVPADLWGAPWPLVALLYAACYVAGGWEPARSGLQALRERTLDVDLLMIVAALGAAAIGQYLDGALLIVIFAGSGALEAVMTARTRAGITGLLHLAPETAHRVVCREPGSAAGVEADTVTVRAADLLVGDEVVVRPGEKVPADGTVLAGAGEIDASSLTGEPLPVPRRTGDEVFAGTLNGTGVLRVRVATDPRESVVAGIAAQVARAAETKSTRQLWVERIERRYSVIVVLAAVAVFVVPLVLGADLRSALLRAMTFMIVASPCAIVLATMPPLLAAIAVAGRRGVLLKEAGVVEALAEVDAVVLDKTGTVTSGRPEVRSVEAVVDCSPDEVLALAAAAEQGSEHVLGRAIVAAAQRRDLRVPDARDTTALPGEGIVALVTRDGASVRVTVGRPDLDAGDRDRPLRAESAVGTALTTHDRRSCSPHGTKRAEGADHLAALVVRVERRGWTAVVVRVGGEAVGVLGLADEPRPGARDAIDGLRATVGEPTLLTGDAVGPARALAERAGISQVRAGLSPADKHALLPEHALAVGDGLNDAPLLAGAHVGLAVGDGAATLSVEAADGVLLRDPLGALAPLVRLARRARRTARVNLAFAAAVIVGLVAWDLVGTLPLAVGVAGHELSTVLVCLNGLRLAVWPGWSEGGERLEGHAPQQARDLVRAAP